MSSVLGEAASVALDDYAQLAGGLIAALCCWFTVGKAPPRDRAWRLLLGLGMAGWTAGQALGTWTQLSTGHGLEMPSAADGGFLALPPLALLALACFPTSGRFDPRQAPFDAPEDESDPATPAHRTPVVPIIDALILVGSITTLTWATALGAVIRGKNPGLLAFGVALAYPLAGCALVVVLALFIVFGRARRGPPLFLLGTGLVSLAVSDGLFAYRVANGASGVRPLFDAGFVLGPVCIALAALAPRRLRRSAANRKAGGSSWSHVLLPYLPLLATVAVMLTQIAAHADTDPGEVWLSALVVVLVLVRQLITLVENQQLLERVKEGQRRLRYQAFHDPLTGLANRALFADRLQHAVALHRSDGVDVALLFIDLDDFKAINDGLGHPAGDLVLREVAERLRAGVQGSDTVARLGGDEFAVLLEGGETLPAALAERLLTEIRRPVLAAGHPRQIGASVGIAVSSGAADEISADDLLLQADAAMYEAKRRGKGSIVEHERRNLATDLDAVLRDDLLRVLTSGVMPPGFGVVYQPIVRFSDRSVVAVEALVRWVHPERGPISPDLFVPAAERAGAVAALDDLVLDRACAELAALGSDRPAVHVNVSASRLADQRLADTVATVLRRHGLPPRSLILEVTETSAVPDVDAAAAVLEAVRKLGVKIAVDDYGAGHGTLHHLHRLPLDELKLDRTLVNGDFSGMDRGAALARSITQVAHALSLTVVAEGIESEQQCADMIQIGCDLGQGYLFGRPAPLSVLPRAATDVLVPPGGDQSALYSPK